MRKLTLSILFCALIAVPLGNVYGQEDRSLFMQGVKAARRGDRNGAFLHFDSLVKAFPKSAYLEAADFALGEYYFSISDHSDAADAFGNFISKYRGSDARPFALIYLSRMLRLQAKNDAAKALEIEVIRFKHGGLIFAEFKEHKYQSAFGKKYRALYFVDRIKIYIDNELFFEIPL